MPSGPAKIDRSVLRLAERGLHQGCGDVVGSNRWKSISGTFTIPSAAYAPPRFR